MSLPLDDLRLRHYRIIRRAAKRFLHYHFYVLDSIMGPMRLRVAASGVRRHQLGSTMRRSTTHTIPQAAHTLVGSTNASANRYTASER